MLRRAAENPELVKDVGKTLATGLSTSFGEGKGVWPVFGQMGGSAVKIVGGCSGLYAAFSYFAALSKSVSNLESDMRDMKSGLKEMNARFDQYNARFDQHNARFDQYNARFDQYNARFDRMFIGTMTLSALMMILVTRRG